jgi:hypothetical protein
MHSGSPALDDPRAVVVVLREVRSARIPQIGCPSPVLRGREDKALLQRRERPGCRCAAEQRDELAAFHSLSLVNADQSFYGDVSDGRTRRAQLQDASNCQANDDESTDQHKDRGQSAFAGETGFAHSGPEPSRSGSGSLLHSDVTPAKCVHSRPRVAA